ncbi:MAG TPA: TonB-dependent receptor [Acidisarcina sp.]|nr:TonB-dependent receptor [Acidisarcina sp.]
MKYKSMRIFGVIALVVFLLCGRSWAQTATGRVIGTVSDQQGAVIPGASVSVIDAETGRTESATTNKDGYFDVSALPIGTYKVSVKHEGFSNVVTQEQKLEINNALRFDIKLNVGETSQVVTVNADVTGVETVNPTVGGSVVGAAIANLPLNGRNVLQLAQLQPGVTESNPDAGGGGFSVSGGRTDAVTYLLDGGLNTNLLRNSVVFNPNPDSVAEFRILSSNYTAEYGRNGGGIISVVTKSGTRDLHGSVYDFLRNDALDANSFFTKRAGLPKDALKRNQYGATLGGPLLLPGIARSRDRNFFFVSYQGQRQVQSVAQTNIPTFTPAEAKGDFSKSNAGGPDPSVAAFLQAHPEYAAGPATINPAKIDPVAAAYFASKLIPTSSTGILNSSAGSTDNRNELSIKLDFQPRDSDKITVSLGGNRVDQLLPFGDGSANVPGYDDTTKQHQYFANIAYLKIFSPAVLNDFRFTVQRSYALNDTAVQSLPGPNKLGIQIHPDITYGPSSVYFDNGLALGFNLNGPTTLPDTTWSYSDNFTWSKGRNNWKFGAGFSAFQDNLRYSYAANADYQFGDNGRPNSIGNQFADFLLGNAANFEQGPSAPNNIRTKATYLFGQDELRVNNHLTLTVGLRYEYNSPKTDTLGRTDGIIPGLQSTRFPAAPKGLVFPGDKGAPTGLYFPDKRTSRRASDLPGVRGRERRQAFVAAQESSSMC